MAGPAAARVFWRLPARFAVARSFGRSYQLRCVVFHNLATAPSAFTAGIRVNISPTAFEGALQFLTAHYTPVRLDDVLTDCDGKGLPERAVLVTFDDAYASVAEVAAPLCRKYKVPAAFFVNAAFLDNRRLAPDNLVCFAASMLGMEVINRAAHTLTGINSQRLNSLSEVFGGFFPTLSLDQRSTFLDALRHLCGLNEESMAAQANLYLTSAQLRALSSLDFEIGNHTYTHTYCRALSQEDLALEIDRNQQELEGLCHARVRSFSSPYGSSRDLTPALARRLEQSGHQAVFLSESVANPRKVDLFHLDRVSTCAESDEDLFFELEVLPRLRALLHQLSPGRAPEQAEAQGFVN